MLSRAVPLLRASLHVALLHVALLHVGLALGCVLLAVACREAPQPAPPTELARAEPQPLARRALTSAGPELAPRVGLAQAERDPVELDVRLQPPDQPLQHLAFTGQRLAQLVAGQLSLRSVTDLQRSIRIEMPGARNVVAGVGGDLVAAGSEHVYRIARLDDQAEVLAPVPRLGPTTILPGADSSDHFWLLYEGIPTLPEFDLEEAIVAPYISVLSWTPLSEFDGRAVSNPGDGSFVYTTRRGLRRVNAAGKSEDLVVTGLGEQVWRLLPAVGRAALWAATPYHLQLLAVETGPASGAAPPGIRLAVVQRIELPPHTVALAQEGHTVAALAVESVAAARAQLRVELYRQGTDERRVLRFDDVVTTVPTDAGAGQGPTFAPEIALGLGRPWVAVFGFGLSVFDWRTGARLFPRGTGDSSALSAPQNLATGSH